MDDKKLSLAIKVAAVAAGGAFLASQLQKKKKKKKKTRVAIIGAGPSGLATLRAFQTLEKKGQEIPELVCFEKQSELGGLWNYSWRAGVDAAGHIVHSSMYKYLWSNAPKECLEFSDYPFEKHFGRNIASYPPRPVVFDYIKGRVEEWGQRDLIKFNTCVDSVVFDESTQQFQVTTVETVMPNPNNPWGGMFKKTVTESYDYVVCASGHYTYPNYPRFEGFETFQGRVLHAKDMRDACEFKDKDVLLIGTSYSSEDIASQLWKYGTKSVTISHRTNPIGYPTWPKEITEVPLLQKVVSDLVPDPATGELKAGGTAYFADGSKKHVDAIILCTGYLHNFPFLSDDLRLNPHNTPKQPKNKIWLKGLYRGIFWMKNPKLIHVGPHTGFFTFNLFDAQAWLARDFIMGRFNLPSPQGMAEHDEMMCAKCDALEKAKDPHDYDHACINFQGDYLSELVALTDYPSFNVEDVKKLFYEWEVHKQESIMGFRDNTYKSAITGSVSPPLLDKDGKQVLWKKAMAETCESFGMWDLFKGNTRIRK